MADNTELVETIAKAVVTANKEVLEGTVVSNNVKTYTAAEYIEVSKKNGTVMGRKKGQKTKLTPEEYMVLKNTPEWDDKRIMDKHGIDADELAVIKKRAGGK